MRHEWNQAIGQDNITFVRRGIMLDSGDGSTYVEIFPAIGETDIQGVVLRGINHFCLRTGDCNVDYQCALAAGGQKVTIQAGGAVWNGEPMNFELSGETSIPVRIAFVRGPDGELIEFFQNEIL